jgi:hypothetical protein
MDKKQIAKVPAPYVTPTIRTLDISELPEKWINALRIQSVASYPRRNSLSEPTATVNDTISKGRAPKNNARKI